MKKTVDGAKTKCGAPGSRRTASRADEKTGDAAGGADFSRSGEQPSGTQQNRVGFVGRGGARERSDECPLGRSEYSGLCDDDAEGAQHDSKTYRTGTGAAKKPEEKVISLPLVEEETPVDKPVERSAVCEDNGEPATTRTVETITLEIRTLDQQGKQVALGYAIEIGRRLVEVKEMLPHGTWGNYLKTQVHYSQSTAENFMKIFREFGAEQQSLFGPEAKSQTLGNLSYSKALALLALPEEEREAFAEEHDVGAMSARELQAAIKAREEAEAEARTAEAARAKMEEDMRAANECMTAAQRDAEEARLARERAEARAEELRRKVEELERNPPKAPTQPSGAVVLGEGGARERSDECPTGRSEQSGLCDDAAAVPDPEELETAREEGAQAAREELERAHAQAEEEAKEKLEKARKELQAAREEAREAKAEQKTARAALEAAQAEAERLRKELGAASNKEVAAFGILFENVQKDFMKMLDQLKKIGGTGDTENHDKLVDALRALLAELQKNVPEKKGSAA